MEWILATSVDPTTLIALYKWNDAYIYDEVLYQKGMLNRDISRFLESHDIRETYEQIQLNQNQ